MSTELDNIDELEALLADLDDLEEPAKPAPVRQQAGSKAKPAVVEELTDDDLSELEELEVAKTVEARKDVSDEELIDLEELEEAVGVSTVAAPAVAEPVVVTLSVSTVDDEIEGLDDVLKEVEAVEAEIAKPVVEAASSAAVEAVSRRRRKAPAEEAASTAKPTVVIEEDDEEPGFLTPTLKTFIEPDQLQGDLEISESNLSKAMIRQAPLFARYSALAAKAQFQADRADQQVDLIEAELDSDIRDDMIAKGIKITENLVKAAIIRHPKYQKAVTRYNEAKAIAEMVKTAADSFRHRRDMLIQMGADRREEMKGAVRVQEHPGAAALRTINGEK